MARGRKSRMKLKRPPKQRLQQFLLVLILAVALTSSIAIFGSKSHSEKTDSFHPSQLYQLYNCSPPIAPNSNGEGGPKSPAIELNSNARCPISLPIAPNFNGESGPKSPPISPAMAITANSNGESGPYHNWEVFDADFQEMMQQLKIFVYSDVFNHSNPFANIFLPLENPSHHPKLGNYWSEHMFKVALLNSPLLTNVPEQAHFFFLPFSINNLRNDPRFHSEASISNFVAEYSSSISQNFRFWNASGGADHFYVCCHSVGRLAASKHPALLNYAIQLTCSSSYFQRFFISHKDLGLPQVWPRPPLATVNSPRARHRLAYFAGRAQNSQVRRQLINLWANDTHMDIFDGSPSFPYEEGFKRSKYCLHVKGYEVNTARISDAIHYGCVPVIISNYYDLPFATVLDWSKFSVIITQADVAFLKPILLAITRNTYLTMFRHLRKVRKHFQWHATPKGYDSFYMTAYQLWLRRSIQRLSC